MNILEFLQYYFYCIDFWFILHWLGWLSRYNNWYTVMFFNPLILPNFWFNYLLRILHETTISIPNYQYHNLSVKCIFLQMSVNLSMFVLFFFMFAFYCDSIRVLTNITEISPGVKCWTSKFTWNYSLLKLSWGRFSSRAAFRFLKKFGNSKKLQRATVDWTNSSSKLQLFSFDILDRVDKLESPSKYGKRDIFRTEKALLNNKRTIHRKC